MTVINDLSVEVYWYSPEGLPGNYKTQILSFYRCIWPWGFQGKDYFRDWITGTQDSPQHLVLAHQDTLIGSLCLVTREVNFFGIHHEVQGFTGVLIYPNFQGLGMGKHLLEVALEKAHAETLAFHCEHEQVAFYEKLGFKAYRELQVSSGITPETAQTNQGVLMLKSTNDQVLQALEKAQVEQQTLYFGQYCW